MLREEIAQKYGNKVRVRACGIYKTDDKVLLVGHQLTNDDRVFWSPPGGEVVFGETIHNCIKREFMEETHLEVEVGKMLTLYEHIDTPLHAIELFYEILAVNGTLKIGEDPELDKRDQSLVKVAFIGVDQIASTKSETFHPVLFKLLNIKN